MGTGCFSECSSKIPVLADISEREGGCGVQSGTEIWRDFVLCVGLTLL